MITEINSNLVTSNDFKDLTKFLRVNHLGVMDRINQITELNKNCDLNLFSRLTIKEDQSINANNIKKILADNRYKYDIITVQPVAASVAAIAARDRRVDSIRIGPGSTLKVFNTRYGRRLEENGKLVEVDLSLFWHKKIAKNLRPLIRILRSFKSCDLKYILHKDTDEIKYIRSYQGLQSIGRLLNLTNQQTNRSHLINRIIKNEKKRVGKIPMEGVEITKW